MGYTDDIGAVLFDMDGVLVDSEEIMMRGAQYALAQWGVQAEPADFIPFIGTGEDRFVGGVAEAHGVPYEKEMKARAYARYAELALKTDIVIPGAPDLLRRLFARGVPCAVCSSADMVKVAINVRALGLAPSDFGALLTGESVERKKPFPDIYLAGAAALGVPPERCVVVEDAVSGVRAGHAAGMRVIAVTTSFTAQEMRDQAAPEWIVEDVGEVFDIVMNGKHPSSLD